MPPVGLERTISAGEWLQTHSLRVYRAAGHWDRPAVAVIVSASLHFRLRNLHRFIICHFTYGIYFGRITCVSLYSVMSHMSVYTRSCYLCHYILGHVTYVSL
jgi:hypothetical protein